MGVSLGPWLSNENHFEVDRIRGMFGIYICEYIYRERERVLSKIRLIYSRMAPYFYGPEDTCIGLQSTEVSSLLGGYDYASFQKSGALNMAPRC